MNEPDDDDGRELFTAIEVRTRIFENEALDFFFLYSRRMEEARTATHAKDDAKMLSVPEAEHIKARAEHYLACAQAGETIAPSVMLSPLWLDLCTALGRIKRTMNMLLEKSKSEG